MNDIMAKAMPHFSETDYGPDDHRYNDDLLLAEPARERAQREHKIVVHVLDHEKLRETFSQEQFFEPSEATIARGRVLGRDRCAGSADQCSERAVMGTHWGAVVSRDCDCVGRPWTVVICRWSIGPCLWKSKGGMAANEALY